MTVLSNKQKIVIIGSGDYVKNLSRFKYQQNDNCEIDCIVSPHAHNKEWISCKKLSSVSKITKDYKNHVFDLSVFPNQIPAALNHVCSIGAKKIILPKPTADTRLDYFNLEEIIKKYNIAPLVSSQWFYSDMFENYQNPEQIEIEFEKKLPETYSLYNSFLPHVVQILNKMNVKVKHFLSCKTKNELKINLLDRKCFINIKNENENKRFMRIFLNGKPTCFDFTTCHKEGKILTYPKIKNKIQKQFKEDVMAKMIKLQLEHFDGKHVDVLDFNGYKEIQNSIFDVMHRAE